MTNNMLIYDYLGERSFRIMTRVKEFFLTKFMIFLIKIIYTTVANTVSGENIQLS